MNNFQNNNSTDEESEDILVNNIKTDLADWVIENSITTSSTYSLLEILRKHGLNLPKTKAGLIKRKTETVHVIKIGKGEYFHVGIENNLVHLNNDFLNNVESIEIDVNIDGVPLFKSSSKCLWPVLGAFVNQPSAPCFVIGVYCGTGHPASVDIFLEEFAREVTILKQNGVRVTRNKINNHFLYDFFAVIRQPSLLSLLLKVIMHSMDV